MFPLPWAWHLSPLLGHHGGKVSVLDKVVLKFPSRGGTVYVL